MVAIKAAEQSPEEKEMQHEPAHHLLDPYETRPVDCLSGVPHAESAISKPDGLANFGFDLSHEVRTSLAIVTLLCGNLDRLYERLEDKDRRTMIHDMRKHVRRLNELVGDVLSVGESYGRIKIDVHCDEGGMGT
jgi:signal transduction histidine kinase